MVRRARVMMQVRYGSDESAASTETVVVLVLSGKRVLLRRLDEATGFAFRPILSGRGDVAPDEVSSLVRAKLRHEVNHCEELGAILNQRWFAAFVKPSRNDPAFSPYMWVSLVTAADTIFEPQFDTYLKQCLNRIMNRSTVQLQFGLQDERILHISELDESQKGLACRCICPNCRTPLIAKLGEGGAKQRRQRHFAHQSHECDLTVAQQTAVHLLAKEILQESTSIVVPALVVHPKLETNNLDVDYATRLALMADLEELGEATVHFNSVRVESRCVGFTPDIILGTESGPLLVEVAVTHFVGDDKAERIRNLDLTTLEIDLSHYHGGLEWNRDVLRRTILESLDNKKWIHHTQEDVGHSRIRERNAAIMEEYERRLLREAEMERQRAADERMKEASKRKRRDSAADIITEMKQPEMFQARVSQFRSDQDTLALIRKLELFSVDLARMPFFVDLPVMGEVAFLCDRRVWQTTLFSRFLYKRKAGDTTIRFDKVMWFVTNIQRDFRFESKLLNKIPFRTAYKDYSHSLVHEAVSQYLHYLALLGFIQCIGPLRYSSEYAIIRHSLEAPNKKMETRFRDALDSIQELSINIDHVLEQKVAGIQRAEPLPERSSKSQTLSKTVQWATESTSPSLWRILQVSEDEFNRIYDPDIDLLDKEFQGIYRDREGYRWQFCTECHKVKREDEMTEMQCSTGVCSECFKKMNGRANS